MKKQKSQNKILICFFIIVFFFLFTAPASAQVIGNLDFLKGIVPCGTSYASAPCTVCHFYKLLQNIINFFLLTSASLATLMAIFIGFLFLFSGGSPENIKNAKSKLWLLVWGIGWVLGSWLVLNTIINFVTVIGKPGDFPTPWNQISCQVSQPSGGTNTSTNNAPTTPQNPSFVDQTCPNCVSLAVPVKPGACAGSAGGQICRTNNSLNDKLTALNQSVIGDGKLGYWWVTEAFPPTVTHQNPCHQGGTCVDANLRGSGAGNSQDIKYFINQAKAAGLNPIYEVDSASRRNQLIASGIPEANVLALPPRNGVPQITGEHFSIYQ